ncbi:Hsp20/alpha crystallin family protein [Roseibium sp.]|uniref:Hsp20/alpha crystallin family protein n=1 Tax=Roseibium sp. TaxID=1936156 RepID=UPI003A978970
MPSMPSLWNDTGSSLASLQKEMERLFQDFGRSLPSASSFGNGFPAIDVNETETGLELTAEVPGIAEKDMDVSVSGNTLTLKGEKSHGKTVSEKDRHVSERSYGAFRRVMTLPFAPAPDAVDAHLDNGVLTVVLPRPAETAAQGNRIAVKRKG